MRIGHRSRLLGAVAGAALLAAGAGSTALAGTPTSHAKSFRNSAHTATCGIFTHRTGPVIRTLCIAKGIPTPLEKPNGGSATLSAHGVSRTVALTKNQNHFAPGRRATLKPGASWEQLGVTCKLAAKNVRCRNLDGHGFVIGADDYKTF